MLAAFVIDGTAAADVITLKEMGANYVATVNGGTPISMAAAAVTSISVNGLNGTDRFELDYSGGNFGGLTINYDGGTPTSSPGDSLRTFGGSFATGISTPTSGSAGAIVYTGGTSGASTINYSGLEPIDDLNVVTNYVINATNALNFINIVNGPIFSGAQTTQVNDGAALFERINFANKANVTINALDGSDQIAINNSLKGAGLASLIVNGGNGDDQFNINGPGIVAGTSFTFNGGADNDLFSVSGGLLGAPIAINGNAHTGGTPSTQDRLTVNSFAANVTQTATQLQFAAGQSITFATLEQINLNNLNTLSVSGTAAADSIDLSKPSASTFRSVTNGGIEVNFDRPLAAVGGQFFANAADGSDTLTVDNNGRVVDLRVAYNASTGANDTLNIFGNPGTPVARESYIVGATQDSGRIVLDPDGNLGYLKTPTAAANGDELDVSSNGLESYFTDVPATIFDVTLAASADNATLNGDGVLLNSSASMLLVDNAGTFVNSRFTKKVTTTVSGFTAADTLAWNSGSLAAGLTNLKFYGFLPPGLGVDDAPASATSRDTVNLSETVGAARNITIDYSDTASVVDVTGLGADVQIGTIETVTYTGTASNNDKVTIVDNSSGVDPARVFNLTASGASYTRNGGVGNGETGPDLTLSGLGGASTPLTIDGDAPTTLPGDSFVYDGPATAIATPTGSDSGNVTAAGVIGIHYQNFEIQTLPGTLTWDGGGTTNNWSEAANWSPDNAPIDGNFLVFPAGAPANSLSNNNDIGGLSLGSVTFGGGGYNISGNAISLANGISANASSGKISFHPSIILTQAQTFTNSGVSPVTFDATINLNGFVLTVANTGDFNQVGRIIGAGGLTKSGSGTLRLDSTTSNYTGITQINGGIVEIGDSNSLGASGAGNNTVVATGATLKVIVNTTGVPEDITLNGNGVGGAGALQTLQCNIGCSISGAISVASLSTINIATSEALALNGSIGGGSSLRKIGAGTLTLGGNTASPTSYSVFDGTLLVTGTIASGTAAVIAEAGNVIMGGTGTINRPVVINSGAHLAPGVSPGVLSTGNLSLSDGSTLDVEITSATAGQFDQVNVTGSVLLVGTGAGVTLNFLKVGTLSLANGDELVIIKNDGNGATGDAVTGTFKNLAEGTNLGSNFLGSGLTAKISYKGGDGNDVSIKLTPGSLFPWHNDTANKANDVRGATSIVPDGQVIAGDALAIINFINANGAGPIPANAVLGLPFGFLDTKKDNQIVPEDVLTVINFINAGLGGEGEAVFAAAEAPRPTPLPSLDLLLLLATDLAAQPAPRRRG